MKCIVNKDKCIGCGNCVALSESKLFDFNDEGLAEAIDEEVPQDMEDIAKDAKEQCPTEAIEFLVKDDNGKYQKLETNKDN